MADAEMETRIARIDEAIHRDVTDLTHAEHGAGVVIKSLGQMMEFAKSMATARVMIPKAFIGSPGDCLAIVEQSMKWEMSPFMVAQKAYVTEAKNGERKVGYEAQLIHAVIQARAPIKGRIRHSFSGEGAERRCTVWAKLQEDLIDEDDDGRVEYISPPLSRVRREKGSPLWRDEPDRQLFYYTVRAWARMHFPDVILGAYAADELTDLRPVEPRDITPDGDESGGVEEKPKRSASERVEELRRRRQGRAEDVEPIEEAQEAEEPSKDINDDIQSEDGEEEAGALLLDSEAPDVEEADSGEEGVAALDEEPEPVDLTPDPNSSAYELGGMMAETGDAGTNPYDEGTQEWVDFKAGAANA